jgi:uncharacterized protein (TIGR02453 family)
MPSHTAATSGPPASPRLLDGFTGFPEGVSTLKLIGGQTKQEFAAGRERWNTTLKQPAEALVEHLGRTLKAQVSPTIQAIAKTNGSLSPINRDLRFVTDKTRPYKDHLLLNFWDGVPKRNAPTLRVRISTDTIGFAAGAAFTAAALRRWRAAIVGPESVELLDLFRSLGSRRELRFDEPELKRAPAGYEPDGTDRDRLIRYKTLQVRFIEPTPDCIIKADFASWAGSRLIELRDIHQWLLTTTQ